MAKHHRLEIQRILRKNAVWRFGEDYNAQIVAEGKKEKREKNRLELSFHFKQHPFDQERENRGARGVALEKQERIDRNMLSHNHPRDKVEDHQLITYLETFLVMKRSIDSRIVDRDTQDVFSLVQKKEHPNTVLIRTLKNHDAISYKYFQRVKAFVWVDITEDII